MVWADGTVTTDKKKTIYYWASNEFSNNGEGILANNFLDLIKKNFQSYNLRPINNFKNINQKTFFYKYILPFWGVLSLWKYYVLGNKVSYVNFLPVWNFLLILLLPPSTILGPITGSKNRLKYNILIKILSSIGVMILKIKFNKLLFSHNFYSSYFKKNKKKYFFNFLLYDFKVSKGSFKKEYDLVFYINKHKNKKNKFLIELIIELSKKYKICVIGEKITKTKNVTNVGDMDLMFSGAENFKCDLSNWNIYYSSHIGIFEDIYEHYPKNKLPNCLL